MTFKHNFFKNNLIIFIFVQARKIIICYYSYNYHFRVPKTIIDEVSATGNAQGLGSKIQKIYDRFHCTECDCSYSRKEKLKQHLQKQHDILMEESFNSTVCKHPGCGETFYHKNKLIKHMKIEHKVEIHEKTVLFDSEEEFYSWKEKEELSNHVYFSKESVDVDKGNVRHMYFYCQRDGHAKAHRRHDEPRRKSDRRFEED